MTVKKSLVQPRPLDRLRRKADLAIALSYCIDSALLAGFAAAGCIRFSVPLAFGAAGFAESTLAFLLVRSFLAERLRDPDVALIRVVPSVAIQMLFIGFVPQLAFFFVLATFIVFGFATLALRARAAAVAWMAVALLCGYVLTVVPQAYYVPHATPGQRLLVAGTVMLALGRCIALGVFSSHMRSVLGGRYLTVKRSLLSSEDDRTRTAALLHEDLAQDLVGISLQISASLSRLARRGVAEAKDLELAAEHLRTAIHKTRVLAIASRPRPRPQPAPRGEAEKLAG
jgi:signal transduction histidine kinase